MTLRGPGPLTHISLIMAFDHLQDRVDGSRIFSALLDLYLNFLLTLLDLYQVGGIWNDRFSKGKLEGGTVLDSPDKFIGKMDVHRFLSSFVLRYRALWDKLMGLLVLIYFPEQYDKFASAKSKKRAFAKIISGEALPDQFAFNGIHDFLEKFDSTFRTAEAHGTGILRKYSFTMGSIADNPQSELIGYWNTLNKYITEVGRLFDYAGNES